MFGFRVPDVDEVMLISGGRTKDDKQFAIHRSSKFIFPGLPRKVAFLSLAQRKANIEEVCNTTQGLPIKLTATVAFKIGRDDDSIYAAGERFRDDQKRETDMATQTGGIFAGHLRSIAGDMTFEAIMRNRQELADKVLDASKTEVANMGLLVDSFQINSLVGPQDYVEALSAPQRAAVAQQAATAQAAADQATALAQARAEQASEEARQESVRNQAEYKRQTLVVQAQYQAEVDAENEKARQSGPLSAAKNQQQVLAEQEILATRQASLRAAQLQAEKIAPAKAAAEQLKIEAEAEAARVMTAAKAEADRTTVQADADAHKMSVQAEAMAANDRVNLDRVLIDQLPRLVEAASQTLNNANVTIFDGIDGANKAVTAAVTQGLSIFNTVKGQLAKGVDPKDLKAIEDMANSGS